jgi:hypothetical protein
MRQQKVTIRWNQDFMSSEVMVNSDGVARFDVPPGATKFIMLSGPKKGAETARVAYLDCNDQNSRLIRVAEVSVSGVVPQNKCAGTTVSPRPGEIVFWALPRPFWDFQ